MRLFVAVSVNEDSKNKIGRIQSVLKKNPAAGFDGIKWTSPENLHITLKFLGEIGDAEIPRICENLKGASAGTKRFEIEFEKIGVFPGVSFPRILWLGVEKGKKELSDLAAKIEDSLSASGVLDFEKDKKPFSAHLTLGRFKRPAPVEGLLNITENLPAEKICDSVGAVYLMKSVLTPAGPVYEPAAEIRLEEK